MTAPARPAVEPQPEPELVEPRLDWDETPQEAARADRAWFDHDD